ncbi:MAG: four helix bundle protein [Candidatus Omnitrophica bacterium]|nr:four helix bundle protein [Candidatus Omnitrophota bacterium]
MKDFAYDFEKLTVYQRALDLAELVYRSTASFPAAEIYGTVSQMRRAAVSVSLNIAEGKGRYYSKIYVQFLYQARGSLYEVIALVKLSHRLAFLDDQGAELLMGNCNEVAGLLNNLIRSLK